jgi:hypothetical protein
VLHILNQLSTLSGLGMLTLSSAVVVRLEAPMTALAFGILWPSVSMKYLSQQIAAELAVRSTSDPLHFLELSSIQPEVMKQAIMEKVLRISLLKFYHCCDSVCRH